MSEFHGELMMNKKTDKQLVEEFLAGNEAAFEDLISRYTTKAFSLATRLTKCKEDAEEVLQDVFVTVHRKLAMFEGKSSFSSWLYRITVNAALMKLRKKKQEQSIPMQEVASLIKNIPSSENFNWAEGDSRRVRSEIINELEAAISELPDEYRPVFILRDIDGLTSKEVSEILSISVPAVKSRLHRSRLLLRKRLEAFYDQFQGNIKEVSNG
jgi:RNA polymerase sigma-70 factor, ECF subfamily